MKLIIFLSLILTLNAQAEYVDLKVNTKGEHSLSTLFHVKNKYIASSEIRLGDEQQTFVGIAKGYQENGFYLIGGFELLMKKDEYHSGAYATVIYQQHKGRYAADFKIRYNEAFEELESRIGLHYAFSDKVYLTVGTNFADMAYFGVRRWI